MNVFEWNGARGGEYLVVELSDGRWLSVSAKSDDRRVWLGDPRDPATYRNQRGGIGNFATVEREFLSHVAQSDYDAELYFALQALGRSKGP